MFCTAEVETTEQHQGSGAGRQGGMEEWMGQVVASWQEWGLRTDVEWTEVRMEEWTAEWGM